LKPKEPTGPAKAESTKSIKMRKKERVTEKRGRSVTGEAAPHLQLPEKKKILVSNVNQGAKKNKGQLDGKHNKKGEEKKSGQGVWKNQGTKSGRKKRRRSL